MRSLVRWVCFSAVVRPRLCLPACLTTPLAEAGVACKTEQNFMRVIERDVSKMFLQKSNFATLT